MPCVNCGTEVNSKFCPNCGQRAAVKRITFKEGWYDFWAHVYGFDGMLPRTLRDLTIRPGVTIREFISGNRTVYYGPVGYFFLMITVVLLVMSLLEVDLVNFIKDGHGLSPLHPKVNSDDNNAVSRILKVVSDNIKFIAFTIIPLQALSARYIFFRKSGLNYLEHSILPFYILGHLYWLTILVVLDYKYLGDVIPNTPLAIVSILFFAFVYSNLINYQPKWKSFLKGIGVVTVAQIMFVLLIALFIIIVSAINPDFYEMIKPASGK